MDPRWSDIEVVIRDNDYLSLATTDGERPWVAPVQYAVDEDVNFYFISRESARHVRQVGEQAMVAFAIFDSQQPPLTGRGIQVEGVARQFPGDRNPFALFGDDLGLPLELSAIGTDYRAYVIEPAHFYVPVADERVEVQRPR